MIEVPLASEIEKKFQTILLNLLSEKYIFGCSFGIKYEEKSWFGVAGNMQMNQPYFIASTTKLFTSAIIMKLRENGKLTLYDSISKFLDPEILKVLHIFKGKEYSNQITIKHLLTHTSGLPDYFQDKNISGESLETHLKQGHDQEWDFYSALKRGKNMKTLFIPGEKGKAHYSDLNFQILGKIIEVISGKSYNQICQELIISPLSLKDTYLYVDPTDKGPKPLYFKKNELLIPKAMKSFGPDGGIVSTSKDMLVFIESFFTGKSFPSSYLEEMKSWNRIFFPMEAGIGIHRLKLPWFLNPFGAVPEFYGHSGLSGALAFWVPGKNFYIAGTVNQIAKPSLSFQAMIKLTLAILKNK